MQWLESWRNHGHILVPQAIGTSHASQSPLEIKSKRICHIPGGRWYDETRNDENKGECRFCPEVDIRQAGDDLTNDQ